MKIGWQTSNFHGYWKIAEEKRLLFEHG